MNHRLGSGVECSDVAFDVRISKTAKNAEAIDVRHAVKHCLEWSHVEPAIVESVATVHRVLDCPWPKDVGQASIMQETTHRVEDGAPVALSNSILLSGGNSRVLTIDVVVAENLVDFCAAKLTRLIAPYSGNGMLSISANVCNVRAESLGSFALQLDVVRHRVVAVGIHKFQHVCLVIETLRQWAFDVHVALERKCCRRVVTELEWEACCLVGDACGARRWSWAMGDMHGSGVRTV